MAAWLGAFWLLAVHRCGPLTESANAAALRFEPAAVLGGYSSGNGRRTALVFVSVQVIVMLLVG